MNQRGRERVVLASLMAVALCVFLAGINWGLASRQRDDPFLFDNHSAWSGQKIADLAGERSGDQLGADVDRNPTTRAAQPVLLNSTEPQRAEIIRRYRLFTYQPDEMITMMALASMKPAIHQFDPKLYQYGGLWIYPIGAMLKLGSMLGWIKLAPSQAFYLEHPEQFARFYIVARLYTVLWAMIGVWAVWRLAINARAGVLASAAASAVYIFLPVVVNMSHEAKPHLPGAVLILLAALSGGKFVQTGKHRWWILCGVLCGSATGMIISGVLAFAILPAMLLMRPITWLRRIEILLAAGCIGAFVYALTNPYVIAHLLTDPKLLRSNLGNSTAMYRVTDIGAGLLNAGRLLIEGATPVAAIAGALGAILLLRGWTKDSGAAGIRLLVVVSGLVLIQFIALAAGKPGEYGRFAILPDIVLASCAAIFVGRARIRTFERLESLGLLLVLTMLPSVIYLKGFLRDSSAYPRRIEYAQILELLHQRGAHTLGVFDDPAPYLLPPVDLFSWRLLLLPRDFELSSGAAPTDVIVRPVDELNPGPKNLGAYERVSERTFDDLFPARISWASKPMEIWVKSDLMKHPR